MVRTLPWTGLPPSCHRWSESLDEKLKQSADSTMTSDGKRKREPQDDRRNAPKERRLRQRQEEMEQEFAAEYHQPTALYKLLEAEHLRSPLFLPRTLSYRRLAVVQQQIGDEKKKSEEQATLAQVTGAKLVEFKQGMVAEDLERFKAEGTRIGLQFALYVSSDNTKFADNSFDLVATCLTPIPCFKPVLLPAQLVPAASQMSVFAVQVVRVNDVIQELMAKEQYAFAAPGASAEAKSVLGADLLKTPVGTREPLSSNLFRIDGQQRRQGVVQIALRPVESKMRGVVQVSFKVQWDVQSKAHKMKRLSAIAESKWPGLGQPKDGYVDTLTVVGETLSKPKRAQSPFTRRANTPVWFHYLYHSMLRRVSEKRDDLSCVWCNMYAGSLSGLMNHLTSSHGRFRFHVSTGNDNVPHIYVLGTQHQKGGSEAVLPHVHAAMCELNMDSEKDSFGQAFKWFSARKRLGATKAAALALLDNPKLDRFHELDEIKEEDKPQEFYAPLLQRQYFHSRTGAVVLDHEKDYDSDDDVDEEWITQQSERLLDEFEDVSLEEKEFMKKWNRHVKEHRILADFMVASSCRLFAKRYGKWLNESGLRYNFLLHLFNLWDNSLLTARAIIDCMLIVDHFSVLEETKAADAKGQNSIAHSSVPQQTA